MATVSERSRELAIALETHSCAEPVGKCEHWNGVIEQALLSERRLAMEEAAKIADEYLSEAYVNLLPLNRTTLPQTVAQLLRAAAEKEGETK